MIKISYCIIYTIFNFDRKFPETNRNVELEKEKTPSKMNVLIVCVVMSVSDKKEQQQ